jgi:hypothetical protein
MPAGCINFGVLNPACVCEDGAGFPNQDTFEFFSNVLLRRSGASSDVLYDLAESACSVKGLAKAFRIYCTYDWRIMVDDSAPYLGDKPIFLHNVDYEWLAQLYYVNRELESDQVRVILFHHETARAYALIFSTEPDDKVQDTIKFLFENWSHPIIVFDEIWTVPPKEVESYLHELYIIKNKLDDIGGIFRVYGKYDSREVRVLPKNRRLMYERERV